MFINKANQTVFGVGFTKLSIDNKNRNPNIATIITDENSYYYEVDELEMRNHGVLHIHGSNSTFVVHNFTGDRTGLVRLRAGQKMFVQVVESTKGKRGKFQVFCRGKCTNRQLRETQLCIIHAFPIQTSPCLSWLPTPNLFPHLRTELVLVRAEMKTSGDS